MIDAIKNITSYESMTPAEIAAKLKATGVTVKPINRASLMDTLNKRGVLRKVTRMDQPAKWVGTALAMQAAIEAIGDDNFINAFDEWFSHITNPTNITWDTTQAAFAAPFAAMVAAFADGAGMPTNEDFEAIVELGDGWRFADVTPEQVQVALDAEAERVAAELLSTQRMALQESLYGAAWNTHVATVLDGDEPTLANLAAGLRALADAVEGV